MVRVMERRGADYGAAETRLSPLPLSRDGEMTGMATHAPRVLVLLACAMAVVCVVAVVSMQADEVDDGSVLLEHAADLAMIDSGLPKVIYNRPASPTDLAWATAKDPGMTAEEVDNAEHGHFDTVPVVKKVHRAHHAHVYHKNALSLFEQSFSDLEHTPKKIASPPVGQVTEVDVAPAAKKKVVKVKAVRRIVPKLPSHKVRHVFDYDDDVTAAQAEAAESGHYDAAGPAQPAARSSPAVKQMQAQVEDGGNTDNGAIGSNAAAASTDLGSNLQEAREMVDGDVPNKPTTARQRLAVRNAAVAKANGNAARDAIVASNSRRSAANLARARAMGAPVGNGAAAKVGPYDYSDDVSFNDVQNIEKRWDGPVQMRGGVQTGDVEMTASDVRAAENGELTVPP